jgi:hypothetical protein
MSNFVIRKIRHGKVKINGVYYAPSNRFKDYDNRLDGQLYVFGLYDNTTDFVSLWGSKKMSEFFQKTTDWKELEKYPDGDDVMDDGKMPWVWWNKIDTESK